MYLATYQHNEITNRGSHRYHARITFGSPSETISRFTVELRPEMSLARGERERLGGWTIEHSLPFKEENKPKSKKIYHEPMEF
ncbi:hypothetical protein NPIL_348561 [Nephila pilipes]|uniref:Uncharacterized protein n=1 Tax=Nephila pilipes TaxID=299642 RepID=A0A8X6SYL8_NEPPI|nr:hypothetical protein NPIL_348561 [Nephila pilipes]